MSNDRPDCFGDCHPFLTKCLKCEHKGICEVETANRLEKVYNDLKPEQSGMFELVKKGFLTQVSLAEMINSNLTEIREAQLTTNKLLKTIGDILLTVDKAKDPRKRLQIDIQKIREMCALFPDSVNDMFLYGNLEMADLVKLPAMHNIKVKYGKLGEEMIVDENEREYFRVGNVKGIGVLYRSTKPEPNGAGTEP